MGARIAGKEAGPRVEVAGNAQRVNKGVAINIGAAFQLLGPGFSQYIGRHRRAKGKLYNFTPNVDYRSSQTQPFTADVSLTVTKDREAPFGIFKEIGRESRLSRLTGTAERIRSAQVKDRLEAGRTEEIANPVIAATTDVVDEVLGTGLKIYRLGIDGVALNPELFTPADVRLLNAAHIASGISLFPGLTRPQIAAPDAVKQAPDGGIEIEQVPPNNADELRSYATAIEQFRRTFGSDPINLVLKAFSDPYANYQQILDLLQHGTYILARSAEEPGAKSSVVPAKSAMELRLDAHVVADAKSREHTRRAAAGLAKTLGQALETQDGEGEGIGRVIARNAAKAAQSGIENTLIVERSSEDDLLEQSAVAAIKLASTVLGYERPNEEMAQWQTEVREVVGYALDRIGLNPIEVPITRTGGMKDVAAKVMKTYSGLRELVAAPQRN